VFWIAGIKLPVFFFIKPVRQQGIGLAYCEPCKTAFSIGSRIYSPEQAGGLTFSCAFRTSIKDKPKTYIFGFFLKSVSALSIALNIGIFVFSI
jgi:hypothetical protein